MALRDGTQLPSGTSVQRLVRAALHELAAQVLG